MQEKIKKVSICGIKGHFYSLNSKLLHLKCCYLLYKGNILVYYCVIISAGS